MCESEAEGNKALGIAAAAELRRRLADLDAAPTFVDLPPEAVLRKVDRQDQPEMIVGLRDGWEMAFTAGHLDNPVTSEGEIDWTRVTRVRILWIARANG